MKYMYLYEYLSAYNVDRIGFIACNKRFFDHFIRPTDMVEILSLIAILFSQHCTYLSLL